MSSDRLEQIMKKIHVYFANCQESPYSTNDLIVSKERIFSLLEELNYAVYEAMEDYELTQSARERGIAQAERKVADIKTEAMHRAEEIQASSLLHTQEAISDMKSALKYMQEKVRIEYELLLMNYEEKLNFLEKDSLEIISQLQTMNDAKYYLRLIEEIKAKHQRIEELEEQEEKKQQTVQSKNVGSVESSVGLTEEYQQQNDEFESKLGGSIVVEVHDTPRMPTGFKKKKKKGKFSAGGEAQISSQELDAEYFAFQEEQQALATQGESDKENAVEEKEELSIKDAFRRLGFGSKKGK